MLLVNGQNAAVYFFALYLIRRGWPTTAAILSLIAANISIFGTSNAVGKLSFVGLYSIATVIMSFLVIDGRKRGTIIAAAVMGWFFFVLAFTVPDYYFMPFREPRLAHNPYMPIIVTPFITAALVYHTYNAFMKLLVEAEQRKTEMFHQSRMAALGEMASGIAHEINNPLQVIGASAFTIQERIKRENIDVEALKKATDRIESTTFRIARIVTGLLNFARGERNFDREPVMVKELILGTLDLCSEKMKSRGVDLRVGEIEDHEILVRPTQISQIILNLLNNSLDAVQTSSEKWVEIRGGFDGKKYSVVVIDSGPRIPPAVADKMMQPFFTTKPVGFGTGLGLSISKGIIEEHGGKIYYDPENPETKFVVEIPDDHPEVDGPAAKV